MTDIRASYNAWCADAELRMRRLLKQKVETALGRRCKPGDQLRQTIKTVRYQKAWEEVPGLELLCATIERNAVRDMVEELLRLDPQVYVVGVRVEPKDTHVEFFATAALGPDKQGTDNAET